MSLSDTFIRRPVLSTVCSILILMAGMISLPLLPIENLPNIAPPTIQVNANLPGADALTVESAVTGPLEEQINGAPGMDYITSNSTSQGVSQINVYFKAGTDPDIDQVNVLNRVQTASAQLPEQVNSQGVTVQQTASSYLLVYNLTSTEGQYSRQYLNGLYQLNLAYPLSRADGVGQVNVFGSSDPAYRLWLDPEKLTRFNLSALDVENALRSQNQIVIGGSIGGPPASPANRTAYPVLVNGNLQTVEAFEDLILSRGPSGRETDMGPDGGLIIHNQALHDEQRFWGAIDDGAKRQAITAEDTRLLEGCTYVVREHGDGFIGEVEPGCRCLVERKGATAYLVSSFELDPRGMRTIDRGHDPQTHEQLWGSLAGPFEFSRTDDFSGEIPEPWLAQLR